MERDEPIRHFKPHKPDADLGLWIDAAARSDGEQGRWLPTEVDRTSLPLFDRIRDSEQIEIDPALFRTFADLDDGEAAILAFSTEHGRLTRGEEIVPVGLPADESVICTRAEHLDTWRDAMRLLHAGTTLWDALAAANTEAVAKLLHIGGLPFEIVDLDPDLVDSYRVEWRIPTSRLLKNDGHSEHLRWRSRSDAEFNGFVFRIVGGDDFLALGWMALSALVNSMLSDRVRTRVNNYDDGPRCRLEIMPTDLLGALWLQFARALDGNRTYKPCGYCGTWMEITPDTARSDKTYCSSTCRSRAHRARNPVVAEPGAQ